MIMSGKSVRKAVYYISFGKIKFSLRFEFFKIIKIKQNKTYKLKDFFKPPPQKKTPKKRVYNYKEGF